MDLAGAFLEKRATIFDPEVDEVGGAAARTVVIEPSEMPNISEWPRAAGAAAAVAREAISGRSSGEDMQIGRAHV